MNEHGQGAQRAADPMRIAPTWRDRAWQTVYRIGFPLARAWWHLARIPHEGSLVAIHVGPALLLVRSSYRSEWNLPGGGVKPGETAMDAALREAREELGVTLPPLAPGRVFDGVWDGRPDRVHVHAVSLDRLPDIRIDNREILEARLVPVAELHCCTLTGPVAEYVRCVLT